LDTGGCGQLSGRVATHCVCRCSEKVLAQPRHCFAEGLPWFPMLNIGIQNRLNGVCYFVFRECFADDGAKCCRSSMAGMPAKQQLIERCTVFINTQYADMPYMVMAAAVHA